MKKYKIVYNFLTNYLLYIKKNFYYQKNNNNITNTNTNINNNNNNEKHKCKWQRQLFWSKYWQVYNFQKNEMYVT